MIKLGLYLPTYGGWLRRAEGEQERPPTYKYAKEVAEGAEEAGMDSLWIPDHLLNPIKGEREPSLEAWTLAVGIAEATERVKISHTTLCEAFRYPAVVAKQAATLSELSGGRFWLSLGACWFKREFEAYGLPWLEHDDRVDRAQEAIQLIKRLWTEDGVNFSGKYYSISNGILEPKPDPRPPIWYAGMSEASRELVADDADGWLMRGAPLAKVRENIADVKGRLEKRGRRKIEFAIPALTFIRDSDQEAERELGTFTKWNKALLDRTLDTGLVGSPETVTQKIKELEGVGVDHLLLQLSPTLPELDRFAARVMPSLR